MAMSRSMTSPSRSKTTQCIQSNQPQTGFGTNQKTECKCTGRKSNCSWALVLLRLLQPLEPVTALTVFSESLTQFIAHSFDLKRIVAVLDLAGLPLVNGSRIVFQGDGSQRRIKVPKFVTRVDPIRLLVVRERVREVPIHEVRVPHHFQNMRACGIYLPGALQHGE